MREAPVNANSWSKAQEDMAVLMVVDAIEKML